MEIQIHIQPSVLTVSTNGMKLTSMCYLSMFLFLKVVLSY